MSLQILKKISIATLSGLSPTQLAELVPSGSAPAFVGRIAGSARGYEVGQSTYGDFLKFKGDFRAWNQAGEMSASVVAFLPAPVDEMLKNAIDEARKESGDDKAPVEFAFDILVAHDPKEGSKGYQYRTRTLTETATADPIKALVAGLAPLPALAAPKAEEAAPAAVEGTEAKVDTKPKK